VPGAPIVEEVGGDFVNLSWDKADDGGGRLEGYIVEKRDAASDRWTRVNYQPIKTLSYNVPNLIEDSSYFFRVLAVNLAGEGKPSLESAKTVVKDAKGWCFATFYFPREISQTNSKTVIFIAKYSKEYCSPSVLRTFGSLSGK